MTFAQIIGHEQQKRILRQALSQQRLAHAYLFTGPEGIGKRLMALAVARALFCPQQGCGACAACRKVDHNNHPDLYLLEPENGSHSIEAIRQLQRHLARAPLEAPVQVCLLEAAEKLTPQAGNALLKTLEEPPDGTVLILLSGYPDQLLPTIVSRCQRLPFARLGQEDLERILQERLQLEPQHSHLLSALAQGSLQQALDQDPELLLEQRQQWLQRLAALRADCATPCFELAAALVEEKDRLDELLSLFLSYYRDLLLVRWERPREEWTHQDLSVLLQQQSQRYTTTKLLNKMDAIQALWPQRQQNVNLQLALENLLLTLAA